LPNYVFHSTFELTEHAPAFAHDAFDSANFDAQYMPDEVTRDHARRMHYAAWRAHQAGTPRQRAVWIKRHTQLRDRIVLGNRKLVYRAVRRRLSVAHRADDMISECHIVLIQAVAAYNPWLGIRFSTYAYTCLVRALSRLAQRLAADWLARSLPLEALPEGGPKDHEEELMSTGIPRLDEYLRDDHPLLSSREKAIIQRRFCLNEPNDLRTLEQVGRELGLSKERVRQVQASALGKLRKALLDPANPS
jgi:RNA polymerase sigma factor (sigma-70 family)